MADGYSASCPYGDGITRIEYKHDDIDEYYTNKQELIDEIKGLDLDDPIGDVNIMIDEITEISLGYIWHPVEFFLTIKWEQKSKTDFI